MGNIYWRGTKLVDNLEKIDHYYCCDCCCVVVMVNICFIYLFMTWKATSITRLRRISQASQALGRLHTRVWHERRITIQTNLSVYRAVVLLSLICGCEIWTCHKLHINKLDIVNALPLQSCLLAGGAMSQTMRYCAGLRSKHWKPF